LTTVLFRNLTPEDLRELSPLMKREPLFTDREHPELSALTEIVNSGRYFRTLAPGILRNMLKKGTLVTLEKDQYLIREGDDSALELYILVEGSLVILADRKFILRLDLPGDVVGELAVIQSAQRSADVITETNCRLIALPAENFLVDENADHASILYVLFAHIMAAKLRITTAQSLLRKNRRVGPPGQIRIGIVDADPVDRSIVANAIRSNWAEAGIVEIDQPEDLFDSPAAKKFDLIIADPDGFSGMRRDRQAIAAFIKAVQLHGAHILILSRYCEQDANREFLVEQGVDDMIEKPCTSSDLRHAIVKSRVWYYKDLELDEVENAAETDRLTGLANRRRLDQFLDALITLYPESKQSFSLVMCDVDDFKHYNDTHGHQMGDAVLRSVAGLLGKSVRRGDLAARYGGEEFVIVLPDCEKSRALEVAEAMRRTVEAEAFPDEEQQPGGDVTVTLGVATFPDDALDLDSLLKRADDCLYEGKKSGKNTVISARPLQGS